MKHEWRWSCDRSYSLLTRPMVSLWSISEQSSRQSDDVAVSFEPYLKESTTARLSPDRVGPPWIAEWPIILPAIRNRSLSMRAADKAGTRWSVCPCSHCSISWTITDKYTSKSKLIEEHDRYYKDSLKITHLRNLVSGNVFTLVKTLMWDKYFTSFS